MSEAALVITDVTSAIPTSVNCPSTPEAFLTSDFDDVPSWLNEAFVEKVLKDSKKDSSIKVRKLIVRPCSAKGDNYASTMHRATVVYSYKDQSECKISLVVKSMIDKEFALKRLGPENYDVQRKEMDMYSRVIPEFKKLLASINENTYIFPNTLLVDETNEVIVMEDLVEKQFVMPSRIERLDEVHIKMALEKMALLHACSVIMHNRDPSVFERFDTGMFNRKTDAFHVFFYTNFEALCDLVDEWEEYKYYAIKLRNTLPRLLENATRAFDCDEGDFHVLCHGDFWTNNTLYRYNANGDPTDVIIIDFQYCHYGSPALDVLYFLHNSTKDEIRTHRIGEMVQFYYYKLIDALERLKFDLKKIPTLHQFQTQIHKKMFYALTTSLIVTPVMINENPQDADFESLMMDDEARGKGFKKRIYQNEKFHKILKQMLPVFDQIGMFDEMYH